MQLHLRNLLLVAPIFLLAACGKTNTQGKLIPKEAAFVLHIDGKSLSSKLSWDEVKQNPAFAEIYKDSTTPATMKSILNNPDSAGIDTKTDLLIFALQDSVGGYLAVEGTIKNEDQFTSFVKTFTTNASENEANGVKFISKAPLCVGYTKDKFIYLFDAPQMANMDALSRRMQQDSIDLPPAKSRDIFTACKTLFALSEGNSLAKNDKFSALVKETGDMHFWMNTEQLTKSALNNPMMAMVNLDKLYKGSATTATLSFENGKINIDAKSYVGDDLAKLYQQYGGGKVSEDMLKRMPGKDIIGLMAIAYKPEGIKEFLKLINLDGLATMGLTKVGFTMDDFIKANKGDLVIGVSDITMKTTDTSTLQHSDDFAPPKPSANFVFAVSIGDKDAFNKLINAGKKLGGDAFGEDGKAPFAYSSNGTYFAIANNKETADKYLAGANSNVDFINKLSGQAFGGYLNIHLLLKSFEKEATRDSSAAAAYDASLKIWDNVLMKGGDMTGNAIAQHIEVNLVDKTTNSLKQINQYAATLTQIFKARRDKERAMEAAYNNGLPAEDVVAPPASTK